MAKARGIDGRLVRLHALRREPAEAGHLAELRSALADASNLVVAEAATIVGERNLAQLASDLAAAFERFMIDPIETDPRCRAKIAIAEALNKVEYDKDDIFLRGIGHFQEAGRPGEDDPAAPLRGISAFGLVRNNHPGVILRLTDLLSDSAVAARVAAAQALGETRSPAAIPLLRFKAGLHDKSPEVNGACLSALMAADPQGSLAFVAKYLRSPDDALRDGAALALGESRRPDALELLLKHWPRVHDVAAAEVLLLAIALTRLPAALDFLLGILATATSAAAAPILSALTIHKHNATIKSRIAEVLTKTGDAAILERFQRKFGGGA